MLRSSTRRQSRQSPTKREASRPGDIPQRCRFHTATRRRSGLAAGCAALEAKAILGEGVRFVTAFHNVSAHLLDSDNYVDCDVLVFSDDIEARKAVVELCPGMGLRGLSGGALANSAAAEALTSILIYMNKTYKADGAGIRFTNLAEAPEIP